VGLDALLDRLFRDWGTICSKALDDVLTGYAQQIDLLANSPRYQSAVPSLTC